MSTDNSKKIRAIIIIVVVVAAAGGLTWWLLTPRQNILDSIVYGTGSGPRDLDPQYAWDSASIDVIDQVCEGLYAYNLTDDDLGIIPKLATADGTWSVDNLNYTVTLRQGVTFHDGEKFNATAVKFTFDRLNMLLNYSDDLASTWDGATQLGELYSWSDTGEPVINETIINSEYEVKFVLNREFGPFQALLTFSGSYILSPKTGSTPMDNYYSVSDDILIGTGPYKYLSYDSDVEVKFEGYADYWGGAPAVDDLVFSVIEDASARNQAMLSGEINYLADPLTDLLPEFQENPFTTAVDDGKSLPIQYIGFNNNRINKTMRQAMSYAIDYDYIIDEIMDGQGFRLESPVPDGMLWSNFSSDNAVLNVSNARKILVDAGIVSLSLTDDAGWSALATGSNPIATYNYTYNTDNQVRSDIGVLLKDDLEKIGVKVTFAGVTWIQFLTKAFVNYDELELYFLGWAPDYNDPSNYLNPLFSNTSSSNSAQVNDPTLQAWMNQALEEGDPAAREALYDQIQEYLAEDLMPWAYCFQSRNWDIFQSYVKGFPVNPMGKVYFGTVYFETS